MCATNPQHLYHRGLPDCPWCESASRHGRDPFPSPLYLGATQGTTGANQEAGNPEWAEEILEAVPVPDDEDDQEIETVLEAGYDEDEREGARRIKRKRDQADPFSWERWRTAPTIYWVIAAACAVFFLILGMCLLWLLVLRPLLSPRPAAPRPWWRAAVSPGKPLGPDEAKG